MKETVNRGMIFWIVFALLTITIIIIVPSNVTAAGPTTWYVDDVLGKGPGNPDENFTTIQAAINSPLVQPDDIIYVYNGIYYEHVTVSKTLTFEGQSKDNTIIDGISGGSPSGTGVLVYSNNITFKNFTIQNTDCWGGLRLWNSYSNKVIGCRISNITLRNNKWALRVDSSGTDINNYNTFENITCTNNSDDSILVTNSLYNKFKNIQISQNQDVSSNGALNVLTSNYNIFENINITKNTYEGFHFLYECYNNTIKNCDINNTKIGIHLGQYWEFDGCDYNNVQNNKIYQNNEHGIFLKHSDHNNINKNIIFNNDWNKNANGNGIFLLNSDWNTIEKNVIYNIESGTQQYGIYLQNSKHNKIQYHKTFGGDNWGIYKNKKDGICLTNCIDSGSIVNCIQGNWIYENENNGIHLLDSNYNQIIKNSTTGYKNKIYDNKEDGILLENSDYNTIDGNKIYDDGGTQQYGIHLKKNGDGYISEDNTIKNNYIYDHQEDGIYLDNSDNNIIEKNEINNTGMGSQQYGIHLYNSKNNTIQYHKPEGGNNWSIYNNKREGIFLENCVDTGDVVNCIKENWIYDNEENGILVKDSVKSTIDGNKLYNYSSGTQKIGILLECSKEITLENNNMTDCGIMIKGDLIDYWNSHTIPTSGSNINEVNNKPVRYHKDVTTKTIVQSPAGEVILANCTNITVTGIDPSNGSVGILLGFTSNSCIDNNTCNSNNYYGICLYTDNEYNILYNNTVKSNDGHGIFLQNENNYNIIRNNSIIEGNDNGIDLKSSNTNILDNNIIVSNIKYGVKIVDSNNNLIYHNNFIDNNDGNVQANDTGGNNYWDNGYPAGGNYWDDFETTIGSVYDDYQGENQNYVSIYGFCDGIIDKGSGAGGGKKPYNIFGGNNKDEYPLIKPIINYRVQRPPIRIDSNTDFNASHGVTGGTGTETDPYIIENWHINGSGYGNCIFIGNTSAYFVIRNCYVYKASGGVVCPWYQNAGITLYSASNGTITSYDWNIGDPYGVGFTITKPTIAENNDAYGIYLYGPYWLTEPDCYIEYILINNCIISNNGFVYSGAGIYLHWARNNNIINNIVSDNYIGIHHIWQGRFNIITENLIEDNIYYGMMLEEICSSYNIIYHNNFINNNNGGTQAYDETPNIPPIVTNYWDNDYPFGGNYWDDFDEPSEDAYDEYRGPLQDVSFGGVGDGIVDLGPPYGGKNPYYISGGSHRDEYPLIKPFVNYRVQRPPIRIDSNTDFNAEHGVTGGNGTEANPWIIEKWDINGTGYGYCLYIGNTTDNFTVKNCYIYDANGLNSEPYYPDSGIVLYNVKNGLIENTVTIFNENDGIILKNSNNNTINNTIASKNDRYGIFLNSSNNYNTISNTVSSSNKNNGILLKNSCNNSVIMNIIWDNDKNGIYLSNMCSYNLIGSNLIDSNSWDGIQLYSNCNYNEINDNQITSNYIGIHLSTSCSDNTISINIINNNYIDGIRLEGSCNSNYILDENQIEYNENGIYLLYDCNYNEIVSNIIEYNSNDEIRLEDYCMYNSIESNQITYDISEFGVIGIHVLNSDENYINENDIFGIYDDTDGIKMYYSYSNTISYNTIGSQRYCIWLYDDAPNYADDNTFIDPYIDDIYTGT